MAKSSKATEDALSLILSELAEIKTRINIVEEKYDNVPPITTLTVKEESETQVSSPKRPLKFQHGIRASGLWKEKSFTLSREPLKYGFKLEKASEYSIWSFSTLKMMEKEGLSDFLLSEVQEPTLPTEESSTSDFGWLLSRHREFHLAAESAILSSVGKSQLALLTRCTSPHQMWTRLRENYLFP